MTSKRTISSLNETGWLSQVVKPVLFVRLDFSSGVKRYHTEIGPITATHPVHGAEVYTGIGDFGGLSGDLVESISGASHALRLSLTGVKSSLITDVQTDDYVNRDIEMMIGLENAAGSLIDDPEIFYSGYMGHVDLSLGERTGIMTLISESRGWLFQFASDVRFTDEDKQAESTGDLYGEYIYRMADLKLQWGKNTVSNYGEGSGPSYRQDRPGVRMR